MSITLINFKAPHSLLERFDTLCRLNGKTRTSVLLDLMTEYTIMQPRIIEARNLEFEEIDRLLQELYDFIGDPWPRKDLPNDDRIGVQNPSNPEFDLPDPIRDDGMEQWG